MHNVRIRSCGCYTQIMKDASVIGSFVLFAACIGAFVVFYGTKQAPAPAADMPARPGFSVPFTELAAGATSSVTERKNYIITSSGGLRELWKLIGKDSEPPVIDFSKRAVIAIFAGTEPAAGYAIAVTKVEDGEERIVTVTMTAPGITCLPAKTPTAPYQVIEVPSTTLPLSHQDALVTTSCL